MSNQGVILPAYPTAPGTGGIQPATGGQVWTGPPFAGVAAAAPPDSVLLAQPWYLSKAITVSRIGVEITAPGTAGARQRLGIYSDRGDQVAPGALLVDAGQVDETLPSGIQSVPFSFANLLTAQQSSLEDGTTNGWSVVSNCTLTNSVVQAYAGTHSLAVTSIAAGDMDPFTFPFTPVQPNVAYTASAFFRAATAGRSCQTLINWYTAGQVFISQSPGTPLPDTTTGWVQTLLTATAPPNAALAAVVPLVSAAGAAGEVHYVDSISLSALSPLQLAAGMYWLASAAEGAPVTHATLRTGTPSTLMGHLAITGNNLFVTGYAQCWYVGGGISGPFPTPYPPGSITSYALGGGVPLVKVLVA